MRSADQGKKWMLGARLPDRSSSAHEGAREGRHCRERAERAMA